MRIVIFNWRDLRHPAAGGAEVYTQQVASRWAAAGHDVTLFCAAVPGCPSEETADGVRVVRGGGRHGVYRAARAWYRGLAGRVDLVVDEINTRPFGCPSWAGDVPVVALAHQVCREIWSYEMPPPLSWAGRYVLEPWWLRQYRDVPVLTVSQSSAESLAEYGLRRVRVVPEGVEHRGRPAVEREEQPTVLFVGRLARNKRPDHALAAYRLLRERMPEARLWFVGDGELAPTLEGAGVRCFGRVPGPVRDELMARAHALVVTSVREGWGLVVDEAAAMGTPAVAYDVPGLRDSVTAAGGVLCAPDPGALARALAEHLPGWAARPATAGWAGGAVDWDTVAAEVLTAAASEAGVVAV
ncbi:glycosyltransferase family 4 protein [Longispora albida]|uniref:glycosyltransferase family 4 protein n=1 Tax=Longispora albida TaxID=203523 RepID=UPI00037BAD7B|nr:glycosyltransferase family 4 protein [Longispora albida]